MIVMTDTARRLLVECGACPEEKVRVVPHGAPSRLTARAAATPDGPTSGPYARTSDRFLLSTFGLISPGKGLETVIEALPAMVERHPEIVYVIAGRTHPDVAHREGERYRLMLERRVIELGLDDHVEFDDRFLSIDELSDLLAATDVFVTPYRNREQIASGALTFAIAAGCGIVSTPYWYAQDMLASGAGRLVPVRRRGGARRRRPRVRRAAGDARGGARRSAAGRLVARLAVGRRGDSSRPARGARPRAAPQAGRRRRPAAHEPAHRPRAHARRRRRHRAARARDHPEPRQRLLRRRRRPPRRRLARARTARQRAGVDVDPLPRARVPARGGGRGRDAQLHELRPAAGSTSRTWATTSAARSAALGEILATAWIPAVVEPTRDLLGGFVAALAGDVSLRTAAYAVLGLARLDRDRLDPQARALLERLVQQLADAYERNATDEWRWFEDKLTYDNARLSQALIAGGSALGRDDLVEVGLESLRWLGDESGLDRRRAAAARAITDAAGTSPLRAAATSSRSTPQRSSRPS